jgi:tetratricopeptide (TPR) repeat protein
MYEAGMNSHIPDGRGFVGRAPVLEEFDQFLQPDAGLGLFVVWGEPGIGKSHLLRRLHERYGEDRSALVDLDALGSTGDYSDLIHALLDAIAESFARWDAQAGLDYLALSREATSAEVSLLTQQPTVQVSQWAVLRSISESPINVRVPSTVETVSALRQTYHPRLLRALVQLVQRCHPEDKLLLLDSFEQERLLVEEGAPRSDDIRRASESGSAWATRSLLPALLAAAGLRIVIAGWADVMISAPTHRVRLTEWSRPETAEYLDTREIGDPPLREAIQTACKGHPAWTALVADAVAASRATGRALTSAEIEAAARRESVDRWLAPMFLARLPARQRPIVISAAVLREFTADGIRSLFPEKDQHTVLYPDWARDLFSFSFVRRVRIAAEDTAGTRRFHPLVRTAILQHHQETEPEDTRRLHQRAADHCQRRRLSYEEYYHRFASGDVSSARQWLDELILSERRHLVSTARVLVDAALAPECVTHLAALDPNILFEAYYAAGRAYGSDPVKRAQAAEAGYELAAKLGSVLEVANFGSQRATAAIQRGDLNEAERLLSAALQTYLTLKNVTGICNSLSDLGWVLEERGDIERAHAKYTQMRDVAISSGRWGHAAFALAYMSSTSQATLVEERGRLLEAAASMAAKSGSYDAVITVQSAWASLAEALGDNEARQRHQELALDAAAAAGDTTREAHVAVQLAVSHGAVENWIAASNYGHRALDKARELNDPALLKMTLRNLVTANLHLDLAVAEAFANELDNLVSFDGLAEIEGLGEISDGVLRRLELALRQEAAGFKSQSLFNVLIAGGRAAAMQVDSDTPAVVYSTRRLAATHVKRIGHVFLRDGGHGLLPEIGRILAILGKDDDDSSTLAHGCLFAGVGSAINADADETSVSRLTVALSLFGPDGDIGCQGTAHSALGEIYARNGRNADARNAFSAARDLWSAQGYTPGVEGLTARIAQLCLDDDE